MDESFAEYLSLGGLYPANSRQSNALSGNASPEDPSQLDGIPQEYFDALMTDPALASMFSFNLNGFSQPMQAAASSPDISRSSQSSPPSIGSGSSFLSSGLDMQNSQAAFSAPAEAPSSQSQQPQVDAQLQLEILRETRRIRELELSILEEKRRAGEVLLKQRETELALVNATQSSSFTFDFLRPPSSLPNHAESSATKSPLASFPCLNDFPASGSPDSSMDCLADPNSPPAASAYDPGASTGPRVSPPASETSLPIRDPSPPPLPNAPQAKKKALVVDEREARCIRCSKIMAKLLLRGTRSELDAPCQMHFQCETCEPVFHPRTTSKKRTNQLEDTTLPTLCSVCTRVQGQGGFISKDRSPLLFTLEVICIPCSQKYKRCSNCGGGSSRAGIGKWRCKELFENNRKTCSLSHARLGTRDMELAVWELPRDGQGRKEYPAMLTACETLWREHLLSKLAVPEVLEHSSALTAFQDVQQKIIDRGFPGRVIFTQPPMTPLHRTYIALTWAKTRPRRDKSKPQWQKSVDKTTDEWIAFNTRKSNVFMPSDSILCGMWFVEWNIRARTLMIGTLTVFDRGEIEDRSVFSYGSMLLRIFDEIEKHNKEFPEDQWHPPEHLWTAPKAAPDPMRGRLIELIQRRLGFLPVDEYVSRYPNLDRSIFSPSSGNVATAISQRASVDGYEGLNAFVRHLGNDIKVENLKKMMTMELAKTPKHIDT